MLAAARDEERTSAKQAIPSSCGRSAIAGAADDEGRQ